MSQIAVVDLDSKTRTFLAYNKDNIFKNLIQAEDHFRNVKPGFDPGWLNCIVKHLAFAEAEAEEAISHSLSLGKEEESRRFAELRDEIRKLRRKIQEGKLKSASAGIREVRRLRRMFESFNPEYDVSRCESCGEAVDRLIKEIQRVLRANSPTLIELEREYADKLLERLSRKYGVPKPKLQIVKSCNDPRMGLHECNLEKREGKIVICEGNINAHVLCLKGDTIVFGSNREISNLSEGDSCLGIDGFEQTIIRTFKRRYEGELIEVKVSGLLPVVMTPDHPVLTCKFRRIHRRNTPCIHEYVRSELTWKLAKDLEIGDYVIVPRRKDAKKLDYIEVEYPARKLKNPHLYRKAIQLHQKNGWGCKRIAKLLGVSSNTVRLWFKRFKGERKRVERIPLTEDVAKFLGLYVAEGYPCLKPRRRRIYLAFGNHETKLIEWVKKFSADVLNRKAQIQSKKKYGSNGVEVVINHSALAVFLARNFGKGAKNKKVAEFIKEASKEIVRAFLDGIILGDGYENENDSVEIGTASKTLAWDLMELLIKIGITPRIYKDQKGNYSVRFSYKLWKNIKAKKKPYSFAKLDDNFLYLPIRRIKRFRAKTTVYNLETEEHVFPVPFIVHNCHEFAHYLQCLGKLPAENPEEEAEKFALRELGKVRRQAFTSPEVEKPYNGERIQNFSGERSMALKWREVGVIVGGQHIFKGIERAVEEIDVAMGKAAAPVFERPSTWINTVGGLLAVLFPRFVRMPDVLDMLLTVGGGHMTTKLWDYIEEYMAAAAAAAAPAYIPPSVPATAPTAPTVATPTPAPAAAGKYRVVG